MTFLDFLKYTKLVVRKTILKRRILTPQEIKD